MIHSFRPKCRVIIRHRTSINSPVSVFTLSSTPSLVPGESMTGYIGSFGENANITTSKGLYDPAGEFQIQLPDKPIWINEPENLNYPNTIGRDSLYGFIEPWDSVEIIMARDESDTPTYPVMRGVIRGVGREETIGPDGRPQRMVVLSGHDFGCLLTVEQIGVLRSIFNDTNPYAGNVTAAAAYSIISGILASTYAEAANTAQGPVHEFIQNITNMTQQMLSYHGQRWEFDFTNAPTDETCWVYLLPSAEGPLWNLISRAIDQPWNEAFIREGAYHPEMVVRRTPWQLNGDISIYTPNKPIMPYEIISLRAHRDDSEVINHTIINSTMMNPFGPSTLLLRPEYRDFYTESNDPRLYGHRIAQLDSVLGWAAPQGAPEPEFVRAATVEADFLANRCRWLHQHWAGNSDLARGTIELRGRPDIRVGDYVWVKRGILEGTYIDRGTDWSAYVTRVTNNYVPYGEYTTTIEYIRSNEYLRRLNVINPWDVERRTGGEPADLA